MTDIEKLRVRGTPELIADLEDLARHDTDTQDLTEYAVDQGIELPEFYEPFQRITMRYRIENGIEIECGLFWYNPDEMESDY